MKKANISRVMARLNLLIKLEDSVVDDVYYLFMKSSKVWADINFVSVRVESLNNFQTEVNQNSDGTFTLDDEQRQKLQSHLDPIANKLTAQHCHKLAASELDKVFGIKNFDGQLLEESIHYIEKSKTVNAITYYHHYFYVISKLADIERLIGLKTIELVPLSLMKTVQQMDTEMHEGYNPSKLVRIFMARKFWEQDPVGALRLKRMQSKKRIGVLFSDLKGFGQIVKKFPSIKESESTQLMIKKYQHLVSLEIKSNGGYVIQTAGDAFMAIFDLPEEITDDIEDITRILSAALGMLAISSIKIDGTPMKMTTRIGINIANVDQGFLGALDLREYTVFGKDVNIASRLEKKVDELAESIDNFAGGILFNISNCKEDIPEENQKTLDRLGEYLTEIQQEFNKDSFRNRILKFTREMKKTFEIDLVFDSVRDRLKSLIKQSNEQEKAYDYSIAPELQEIRVKEGDTKSIFIIKTEK